MYFPKAEEVKKVREQFPEGTRVQLVKMNDSYANLSAGMKGIVDSVDDCGTIHVIWDDGHRLGVVYGEDECKIVPDLLTVNTGINDSTLWSMVASHCIGKKPEDIRATIMDNVMDTLLLGSISDVVVEKRDLEEDLQEVEFFNKFMLKVRSLVEKNLLEVAQVGFADKDWNESFRDVYVTFEVDYPKLLKEVLGEE